MRVLTLRRNRVATIIAVLRGATRGRSSRGPALPEDGTAGTASGSVGLDVRHRPVHRSVRRRMARLGTAGSRYEGVAAVPNVSLEAVPIQQHDLPDDGPPSGMSGQPATSLFDDGDGVSAGRSPDIQMHVQACVLTYVSEELCEGAVARTLDANEDDAPRFYRAPPHPHLNRSSERRRARPRGTWGRGGRRDAGHGHPGLRARGSRHHGSSRQ